jgi:hypothetical protein
MKKITNRMLCYLYYFLGDMVSRPMQRWDWPVYGLYHYLMIRSSDIDEEYGQGWVWEQVSETGTSSATSTTTGE